MGKSDCKGSRDQCSCSGSAPGVLQTHPVPQFPLCNKANAIRGLLVLQGLGPQDKDTNEMP